jgi:hypothetical protein
VKNRLLIGLLALLTSPAFAQFGGAAWIGPADSVGANSWLRFRRDLTLQVPPGRPVRARIACDSKYWLYVNGKLVVFEGQLKRGPSPTGTYFDEVDLGPHLRSGPNTIALLVWYFGKESFSHHSSGRAGLLFAADAAGQRIESGPDWQVSRHPAFGQTGKPHPNYRLPESNVRFDARLDQPDWYQPGPRPNWPPATVLGAANGAPWGQLVRRPVPQWTDSGLRDYVRTEREVRDDTLVIRAYLPQNQMVTPFLTVEGRAGQLVDIRTDNYRGGGEPNVRTEYLTRDGRQSFESPAFFNGHFVIYRLPADVRVLALQYRETRFATELQGTFVASDSFFNRLHQKALQTLRVGLRDHIHDCPDRERAQWWGDVVITMGELLYVADTNAHSALRKAMHELVAWQRPDSTLYSPIPAGSWDKELPPQMLASVGRMGFWAYYEHTGDRATIERLYPAVRRYLALYRTDSRGLVVHRKGGWDWHDWGHQIDVPVLDNAWYALALDGAARMAELLNQPAEAAAYRQTRERLRSAFQATFWTGSGYRSAGYPHGYDDRAQGMAVVAELSEPAHWPALKQILSTTFRAGAYLEKYILEACFQMNDAEAGLARIKTRYRKMVESPLTTLWEGWDIGDPTYGGGTYNHGWTGGPLTLLHQYVAGLAPEVPGYARFRVRPQPGPLGHFEAHAQTVRGPVRTAFRREGTRATLRVIVPPGTTATLGLPTDSARAFGVVTLNGQVVWKGGKGAGKAFRSADKAYLTVAVGPGEWILTGR